MGSPLVWPSMSPHPLCQLWIWHAACLEKATKCNDIKKVVKQALDSPEDQGVSWNLNSDTHSSTFSAGQALPSVTTLSGSFPGNLVNLARATGWQTLWYTWPSRNERLLDHQPQQQNTRKRKVLSWWKVLTLTHLPTHCESPNLHTVSKGEGLRRP